MPRWMTAGGGGIGGKFWGLVCTLHCARWLETILTFTTDRFIPQQEPLEGSWDVLETMPGRRRFYRNVPP